MQKRDILFDILLVVFVVSIVVSNVVGARVITAGVSLFGIELITSGGALTYAFTFLCTDVIGERYGKRQAMDVVKFGFIGQVFALAMITATGWLTPTDAGMDEAYDMLLGQNIGFVIGSLCAYYCGQTWDVWFFHGLRERYIAHRTRKDPAFQYNGQGRWIWNNLSTATSQIIDTVVYCSIAFGIGMKWFFEQDKFIPFIGICAGQYLLKLFLAIIDTPFFYLFTNKKKGAK